MALRDIVGGLHLIKDGNLESVLPYNRILFRALFFEKIVENISNTNHEEASLDLFACPSANSSIRVCPKFFSPYC